MSLPERIITATKGLCILTFTLLLFPTVTTIGKNSFLAVSTARSFMEGTVHCTLSHSSVSLQRQLSYTTDRAEKPWRNKPTGPALIQWLIHRNRALVSQGGRTSIRAARHTTPSATKLTAPFQKDDIPLFLSLAKDFRDPLQSILEDISFPVPFLPSVTYACAQDKRATGL